MGAGDRGDEGERKEAGQEKGKKGRKEVGTEGRQAGLHFWSQIPNDWRQLPYSL